ncbi:hypothetical protein A3C19_01235 [Candidatus Kaiserbacteria bacterium RIFCSPHIGHO2_02_FULL_54_22]|uniref:Uncharacterized protein n=1 Tax=Candidatus Kaiserbacteria bacterium RIFCSPHIGHO2_02_FULL_54_22 TaxID=1798495 RepID=A0A1F6DMB8_9BACT|nr:MAG: hypothetical protein A3C19_01235 [Candidatus Kaiserbacteria bacterium RIFCSPHIGHO2_02_FULL_54_22]OGG68176.1 MAG: hypothetical protein A3E99_03260 [Candidatus Kaiserbacteria bacterium RIFCSPHIGHO2_12_FULL_54_16]
MIASEITDGQIENAVGKLRDAMRKHRAELGSDVVQQVLGLENIGMEMFVPFRTRVEAISNLIVRHVTVNRSRTQQEMLDATSRKQYTDCKIVAVIPRGEGEEKDVFFFNPRESAYDKDGYLSDENLAKEYAWFGFKPDPYAVAAVNEADPAFADEHPNGVHFKDAYGNWCYAAFGRWRGGERRVFVGRGDGGWGDYWSFGGVRK